MYYDKTNKEYIKVLLSNFFEHSEYIGRDVISEFFNEYLTPEKDLESMIASSDQLLKNIEIMLYGLKVKKKKEEMKQQKNYVINGYELTKNAYSLRNEAPDILGVSHATLNTHEKQGKIKCLPEYPTKKVSPEELYNYYLNYHKV